MTRTIQDESKQRQNHPAEPYTWGDYYVVINASRLHNKESEAMGSRERPVVLLAVLMELAKPAGSEAGSNSMLKEL